MQYFFYKSNVTEIELVISYQFLCVESEYGIQIAKLALVFLNYNLKKKLIFHHKMHFNAFTIWFYKSPVIEIKLVISYQLAFAEHEYDIQIANLALFL